MKMSFRWYGESDPISLEYISQIPGMHSIVSAVYDVKPGEVWPEESLAKMKKQCEEHGLVFEWWSPSPCTRTSSWAATTWTSCWKSIAKTFAAAPNTA